MEERSDPNPTPKATGQGVPPPQPPPKKRRRLKTALLIAAGLILVPLSILAWLELDMSLQERAYRKHLAERIAQYDASRPALPDEENAAPLYEEAFKLYVPRPNDCVLASREDANKPAVLRYLAANGPYLEAMSRAAARPPFLFAERFDQDESEEMKTWEDRASAMVFLSTAARHAAYSDKPAEALRLFGLILRLSRDLSTRSLTGSALAASETSISRYLRDSFDNAPASPEIDEGVVRLLGNHLAARPGPADFFRANQLHLLKIVSRCALSGEASETHSSSPQFSMRDKIELHALRLHGMFLDLAKATENTMDEQISALERPYPQALDCLASIDARSSSATDKRAMLGGIFTRSATFYATEDAASLAMMHATRLAFACRLHRQKFGAYPEKLSDLVDKFPEHFKELPVDPFSGKTFLYKRTESGCIVWSVGEDRVNDGGDPNKDIVFELKK